MPKHTSKEGEKCDGCKLFSTMGVHSFTCPIRNEIIKIVPSPRIDYCGDCNAEHGYHCPKDISPHQGVEEVLKEAVEECLRGDGSMLYASVAEYIKQAHRLGIQEGLKQAREKAEETELRDYFVS